MTVKEKETRKYKITDSNNDDDDDNGTGRIE